MRARARARVKAMVKAEVAMSWSAATCNSPTLTRHALPSAARRERVRALKVPAKVRLRLCSRHRTRHRAAWRRSSSAHAYPTVALGSCAAPSHISIALRTVGKVTLRTGGAGGVFPLLIVMHQIERLS